MSLQQKQWMDPSQQMMTRQWIDTSQQRMVEQENALNFARNQGTLNTLYYYYHY
jgi:hypothetical protein